MLSATLHLTALLLASSLTTTHAQSPSSFPAHCLPRLASSPPLSPQSCASALNDFLSSFPSSTNLFTTSPSPPNSIPLPYDHTYMDCRLRIELLYASAVTQSVQDVWAQGIALTTACVVDGGLVGGRIFVDEGGLTVSLRPAGGDDGWEGRFNGSSVVVGGSAVGGGGKGLVEVTAGGGGG